MKHNVSELEGALLDQAVAVALGIPHEVSRFADASKNWVGVYYLGDESGPADGSIEQISAGSAGAVYVPFSPSTSSAWGGPIIERERIDIDPLSDDTGRWLALCDGDDRSALHYAKTPLIAAMRAYVASKLGEEIDL